MALQAEGVLWGKEIPVRTHSLPLPALSACFHSRESRRKDGIVALGRTLAGGFYGIEARKKTLRVLN